MAYVFNKQDELTEEVYINKTMTQFISEFSQKIGSQFVI